MAESLSSLTYRLAGRDDCKILGELNRQLIVDEGHRNRMNACELAERMRQWLESGYRGVLFEMEGAVAAYAVFREGRDEVYLRQLFVSRGQRRRGIGRRAVEILRSELWPPTKRLTVEVLVANESAVAFWRAIGFQDYALTLEILPSTAQGNMGQG